MQLRDNLPLPELTPWDPPPAFQAKLQEMGLGSVAAVLDSLQRPVAQQVPSEPDVRLVNCWHAGQRCRRRADISGAEVPNPWQQTSEQFGFWAAGYAGEPLPGSAISTKDVAPLTRPEPVSQPSLF